MFYREDQEKNERNVLKPYACFSDTAERINPVKKHYLRTEFQRDRDRIIHSKSFRRLEFKTQVYLSLKGDHMRTRLTHSLEVSQISRTIALQLGLNVDLVEAIALGHDVGHTPFGHAAEKKLDNLVKDFGLRFKHNMQSIRVFELLESKYDYEGLRLSIPVLEGILKHTSYFDNPPDYFKPLYINQKHSITLEGQVVAIADEIAQITHDLDDFLRTHILTLDTFMKHEIFEEINKFFTDTYNLTFNVYSASKNIRKDVIISCLVDFLVSKLISETSEILDDSLRAYELDKEYITFGKYTKVIDSFHEYVSTQCFKDYRVIEMDKRGKNIVSTLFDYYNNNPEKMPETTFNLFVEKGIIVILDYISGMTDRYALDRYNSLIEFD